VQAIVLLDEEDKMGIDLALFERVLAKVRTMEGDSDLRLWATERASIPEVAALLRAEHLAERMLAPGGSEPDTFALLSGRLIEGPMLCAFLQWPLSLLIEDHRQRERDR
jgi:hypothetical protein